MFIEKQVKYSGDVISCNGDEIKLVVDSNIVKVKLFNVLLNEDVCPLVYNAHEVMFEVGEYGTVVNEVSAYVFLDDVLLQKTIVEEELGIIKIDNPMYEYYSVIHEEQLEVSSSVEIIESSNHYQRDRANKMIGIMTIIYVILLIIIFRRKVLNFIKF
ncbi:MAG: hypothetical protein IKM20_06410 [Erysipelotrichales bacterium]|nr:hypothetical protein [Erysipelotrichales bacterium]